MPRVNIGATGKFLIFVALGLAFLAIFSAVALSGALGTGFALSWIVSLIIGVFGAFWLSNQFRDLLFNEILGMMLLFIGFASYLLGILPDISLILAVMGAMTLIFTFVRAFAGGATIVGLRGAGAPPPPASG